MPEPATATAIEVFRPGQHTALDGRTLEFSAADVADIAASYDPARWRAPLVIGHPRLEDPAYGHVKSLRMEHGRLLATPEQVEPAFAAAVNAGRYPRVSASLFAPASPNHPRPGHWYLRHVGFLGGAAPAVTGLKPAQFAGDAEGVVTIEFAASQEETVSEKDLAAREAAVKEQERQLAEQKKTLDARAADREAAVKEQERQLAEQKKTLDARAAEFAASEAKGRRGEDDAVLEAAIKAGRVLPAEKPALMAVFAALDTGTLEFADGAGGTARKPARTALADFLKGLPKRVEFAEVSGAAGTVDFADPAIVAVAARVYQGEMAKQGVVISATQAVEHVTKGGSKR